MTLTELIERSQAIRQAYHQLENQHHGTPWSIKEDLLALGNDIGHLNRLVMTQTCQVLKFTYCSVLSGIYARQNTVNPIMSGINARPTMLHTGRI